ncbi:MAG TPA: hypothetical protein VH560_02300 [Polyangia bacterium]|jgi:hypothetical protein|nr:hypothetical protein [Polyangia bacterium]
MKTNSLKITSGLKAGRITQNHNRALKVTTGLKGGRITQNHSRLLLRA